MFPAANTPYICAFPNRLYLERHSEDALFSFALEQDSVICYYRQEDPVNLCFELMTDVVNITPSSESC